MKFNYLLLTILIVTLSACSGTPSESAMGKQVEGALNKSMKTEFVKVENVEKQNSRQDGNNVYIADLKYDIKFTKSVDDVVSALTQGSNPLMTSGLGLRLMRSQISMKLKSTFGNFKPSDVRHAKDTFKFAKSEKGWILIQQ